MVGGVCRQQAERWVVATKYVDLWPRFARPSPRRLAAVQGDRYVGGGSLVWRLHPTQTTRQEQQSKNNKGKSEMRKRGMLILTASFALALLSAPATPVFAAELAPAVIDNERVKVFDTTESIAAMPDDFVAISFAEGTAMFGRAGETAGVPGIRTIVIDLKNHPVAPLANNTGYPNAFPRPHVEKLFAASRRGDGRG